MRKTISVVMLATLVCGAAMAQGLVRAPGRETAPMREPMAPDVNRFGGNLELNTCTGCNFDEISGGYFVWGTNNCTAPGTTQWIGVPFVARVSGNTRSISAGIEINPACPTSTNSVTLSIYSDDCTTGPGVALASARALVPVGPCMLARARVQTALTAGTRYWVVATTVSPQQDGLDAIWYGSNQSQIGGNVASGGWFFFNGFVPSFSVD
jgi:hypothetical protein